MMETWSPSPPAPAPTRGAGEKSGRVYKRYRPNDRSFQYLLAQFLYAPLRLSAFALDVVFSLLSFRLSPFIFLLFFFLSPISAQSDDLPLNGPLVAATPAAMDRILLYDMGGQSRELRFGAGEHHVWGFSPDGCEILFTLAETGGYPRLYAANLDGSDARELVAYPDLPDERWGVWEPNWSAVGPDGAARIAFTLIREQVENGEWERINHLAVIDPAVTRSPQIPDVYSVTGREFTPRWSPDGAWLAYVSYDERVAGIDVFSTAEPTTEAPNAQPNDLPAIIEADIWVVNFDGETKYRLTTFQTGSARDPRWSPDGELVGFIYSPSPSNDMFWMIANQQGAIPTQLSAQWNLTLAHTWFPDSAAMLAAVRDFQETSENLLWRVPLVGNADTDAVRFLPDLPLVHADYPAFSADGRYLAFRSAYVLTLVDTLDNTSVQLDVNVPGNTPPVWTPAGFTSTDACG